MGVLSCDKCGEEGVPEYIEAIGYVCLDCLRKLGGAELRRYWEILLIEKDNKIDELEEEITELKKVIKNKEVEEVLNSNKILDELY